MTKKKYQQVADTIKQRIFTHAYPPKMLLPKQSEFAEEFGVSKITIKKALDGIAREGLIYKKSGLGTYVLGNTLINSRQDAPANAFDGLYNQQGANHVTSKVIKFEIEFPTEAIQAKLGIEANEPVYDILRLRLLDDQPFILEHTYMPIKLVPDLSTEILEKSIYDYIHRILKLQFGGAYRKIHANLPDADDVKYLQAGENTPILEVEQIVWLTNGKNIEYSTSRNLYNARSYTVVDLNDL